jgi:UDP-N-acetylmuramoyl-L-alanyl-D-glutamate--2,6-diaminopimelate ligase
MEIDLRLFELIKSSRIKTTQLPSVTAERLSSNPEILGITSNSKEVKPGYLFAALPGLNFDGRQFIDDALARGAVAILLKYTDEVVPKTNCAEFIYAENPRRHFALIAAEFYKEQPNHIAAVTGTNGKTSVVEFARQLWTMEGKSCASLGTLGISGDNIDLESNLTSPDIVSLHSNLRALSQKGITNLAIEASSHGLDQNRLDGLVINSAAFTNLTLDHLDYHLNLNSYFSAKARLFLELLHKNGVAVLNADSPYFQKLENICIDRQISIFSYGYSSGANIRIIRSRPMSNGQQVELEMNDQRFDLFLSLMGEFQLFNALAALGLVSDGKLASVESHLNNFRYLYGVRGRLEYIGSHKSGAPILVDYAHTPNALENILSSLRPHVQGRLVCVFGAGGDRDKEKRPLMGVVVEKFADTIIVTDDNPRSENPKEIREAILMGCPSGQNVAERAEAINVALSSLNEKDLLVIAGKGHETSQEFDGKITEFDDAAFVKDQLKKVNQVVQ